jgi:hypothetical protein
MYGTDQYINQYETELGPPWKAQDVWLKVSYPFFHADRIKTPTLFMCGEKDFNVPLLGSEQMYQALKSLDVDTELVIYPNQYHGITTPSYKKDRLERYVAWYDKYLKRMRRRRRKPPAGRSLPRRSPGRRRGLTFGFVHVCADHVLRDCRRIRREPLFVQRRCIRIALLRPV